MTSSLGQKSVALLVAALAISSAASCHGRRHQAESAVRVTGSDTMVNLAQAWQEAYNKEHPEVSIQINGGGSGVGIASLCSGKIEIATASRPMKPSEIALAVKNTGETPKELIVGRDGLAIYVCPRNPLDSISLPQLAEIYGENGQCNTWLDLGIENSDCTTGEIIRISRQNSSGTYQYFKEAVLGKQRDYKPGFMAQSGSSDIVALVSKTPCAIGYSGMGYRTEDVKVLKIAKQTGGEPIEPTAENVTNGKYPIARPLFLYTLGEPKGQAKKFIEWILSAAGQRVVDELGYVPVSKAHDTN